MGDDTLWVGALWALRELFGLIRRVGDRKAEGTQWFVDKLEGHMEKIYGRLGAQEDQIKDLWSSNNALVLENGELKERVDTLTDERDALRGELRGLTGEVQRVEKVVQEALPAAPTNGPEQVVVAVEVSAREAGGK